MKFNLTLCFELVEEAARDKSQRLVRAKASFGIKGAFEWLFERLEQYPPSLELVTTINELESDMNWSHWVESRSVPPNLNSFEAKARDAAEYLSFLTRNAPVTVLEELQAIGTLLLELSSIFKEERPEINLSKLIQIDVFRGCLLCGKPFEGKRYLYNRYCESHDSGYGPNYKTGLNQSSKVCEYLKVMGEFNEFDLPITMKNEQKLRHMWRIIARRVGGLDWDLMQHEFERLVVLAHPKKLKARDNVEAVKSMLASGMTQSEIARQLGVSRQYVHELKSRLAQNLLKSRQIN